MKKRMNFTFNHRCTQVNTVRNLIFFFSVFICVNLWFISNLHARPLTSPPSGGHRIWDSEWLNINRWRCPFYNDGRYGFDVPTRNAGGYWPFPYKNYYIFGAGPWVGAIVRNDTFVTYGYNPNNAGSEFFPTTAQHWDQGTGNAMDRIYKSPLDWPPPASRFGTDSTLVPRKSFSLQDMWCVYCDLSPDPHVSPGQPLGIEIYQTIYAWNYPTNQDIFFITYKVKNVNATDTIKKMILGACMDPDVGQYADDMVGLVKERFIGGDTVRNVGFTGDNDNLEAASGFWQSGTPGVAAYKFLESPKDQLGNPLGMTAFKKFTIDIDPVRDVDQYKTMAGFDYRTGVRIPYDSIDEVPADKRFIQCTGPFNLAPGAVATIIVACLGAPYGSANEPWAQRDTNDLKPLCKLAATAQFIYDKGWLLPGPPSASNAVLIPMDKAVSIVWDDLSERTPDPYYKVASDTTSSGYDPAYRQFDFEGYKIYKSTDGVNYSLLGQCDLANGITFIDSTQAESIRTIANDRGVYYSLTDTRVTNGFTYYYRIASYDYNFTTTATGINTIYFENNPPSVTTQPRWSAPNYRTPYVTLTRTLGNTNNPGMKCSTKIVTPFQITRKPIEIKFAGPLYVGDPTKAIYRLFAKCGDSIVLDTVRFTYTIGTTQKRSFPPMGGAEIISTTSITIPTKPFDSIRPLSGNYSNERLTPRDFNNPYAKWAFRGSDYKIVWETIFGIKTCRVYDMTNGGLEVPKTSFRPISGYDSLANGWCFSASLTGAPDSILSPATKVMYINCGHFNFNLGNAIGSFVDSIADGDEWYVRAYSGARAAPYYNVFQLIGNPPDPRTDTTYTLNVKVVPNPYIITNRWEASKFERKIAFTHLPATCNIRIFTMAGNLVKIIKHTDRLNQPMDKGGTEYWNLLNEHDQLVASGVYIFHIESDIGEQIGKFAVIQ